MCVWTRAYRASVYISDSVHDLKGKWGMYFFKRLALFFIVTKEFKNPESNKNKFISFY